MDAKIEQNIKNIFEKQKSFFKSNKTKDIEFRKEKLLRFREIFLDNKDKLLEALEIDLGKSAFEAEYVEIQMVVSELDYILENIDEWAKPVLVPSKFNRLGFKTINRIIYEPYGVTYIIGPFNYPVQLTFSPLIGALISGNTAIIKPSENTPNVSALLQIIIEQSFEEEYVSIIEGGKEENTLLLSFPFDYIFFTGSSNVGRIVMKAAAEQLVPVTLELGGKSPTIIHEDADIDKAVSRISYGKWINCGQTCVAPDYIYIYEGIKDLFIEKLIAHIKTTYNDESFGKIGKIGNQDQIIQLASYLEAAQHKVVYGGKYDVKSRYFEATLMDNITWEDLVMQQEIFGPILPIMTYYDINEALEEINSRPKPLALYVFSENLEFANDVINKTTSGDAEINSTVIHVGSHRLPFGGVGGSGMGKYHGKFSFECFSHKRSIVESL